MPVKYESEVYGKGGIYAKVVADSIANEVRITTFELRYPRFILAELNTHRMFSRNSASSRAIPVSKMIEQVRTDTAIPIHWGKNQPGMKADEEMESSLGRWRWLNAADAAIYVAAMLDKDGYHKQLVNRILEPFQFMKTVLTATEFHNFFNLRDHRDAQPEIAELAKCMKQAVSANTPTELEVGEWHLPYVEGNDNLNFVMSKYASKESMLQDKIKCSSARCARVSYLNHDKSSPSVEEDLELFNMLATRPFVDKRGRSYSEDDPVHCSPLEHPATPMGNTCWPAKWGAGQTHEDRDGIRWSANFRGWIQYRQLFNQEV